MTKLLNGDEDGPKVRAAERASGRFMESCPDSIYSVYVKEVGVAVQLMLFGVVFLGDGINTYTTVVMKVETDITSKAVKQRI